MIDDNCSRNAKKVLATAMPFWGTQVKATKPFPLTLLCSKIPTNANKINKVSSLFCRYLRLELLEGIVAFHCGRFEAAEKLLRSAHTKYNQVFTTMFFSNIKCGIGIK